MISNCSLICQIKYMPEYPPFLLICMYVFNSNPYLISKFRPPDLIVKFANCIPQPQKEQCLHPLFCKEIAAIMHFLSLFLKYKYKAKYFLKSIFRGFYFLKLRNLDAY